MDYKRHLFRRFKDALIAKCGFIAAKTNAA
jgi:hypothetical protein